MEYFANTLKKKKVKDDLFRKNHNDIHDIPSKKMVLSEKHPKLKPTLINTGVQI